MWRGKGYLFPLFHGVFVLYMVGLGEEMVGKSFLAPKDLSVDQRSTVKRLNKWLMQAKKR